ncbi:hypothetical protein [Streptomyces sp. NBC_01353]|uniref:hypothetical protein n=1 Tax=Streptomyces sp. NBC_01353 TaxID=2903835 RepID=UPI002E2EA4C9|nr:hypothetical protein [Streptomyces sp. NBC_01353]
MVNAVLIGFIVLSVVGFLFGLALKSGEGQELKRMTELDESGIEVQARVAHVMPVGTKGYGRVLYEFDGPNGESLRHEMPESLAPHHVVGATFPLVHHPRAAKNVKMGTMTLVRKERRMREGSVKGVRWFILMTVAVCALAVVGLVLSP